MTDTPSETRAAGPSGDDVSSLRTLVNIALLDRIVETSSGRGETLEFPESTDGKFKKNASILMIGFRGSGKTTVGLLASTFLGRPFIDADILYERVFNVSVKDTVTRLGWETFREHETALLKQLLQVHGEGKVIVLGGGVVDIKENRRLLTGWARSGGPVIHVCRNKEEMFSYLLRKETRSTWATWKDNYINIWNKRLPWYEECSNLTFVSTSPARELQPPHPLALKHIELDLPRFLRSTVLSESNPSPLRSLASQSHTTSLFLSGDDEMAFTNAAFLDHVTAGCDAVELKIDTLIQIQRERTPSPTQVDHTTPPPNWLLLYMNSITLRVGFLRQNSPLPIIYCLRTSGQGLGAFGGSKEEYITLVHHGFKLGCDFVDVELKLSDDEIRSLLRWKQKSNTQIIMTCFLTNDDNLANAESRWGGPKIDAIYQRAVSLGADLVKIVKPVIFTSCNLDLLNYQAHMKARGGVPLIALNFGFSGRSTLVHNQTFTPVTHQRLSTRYETSFPCFSYLQFRDSLLINGLVSPKVVYDYAQYTTSHRPTINGAAQLQAGFEHLSLNLSMAIPSESISLQDLFHQEDFAGVLFPQRIPIQSPSPVPEYEISAMAGRTGSADIALVVSEKTLLDENLQHRPQRILLHNLNALAIQSCISNHLSPANAISNRSSAIIVGADGWLGREVMVALSEMCVPKVFTLGSTPQATTGFTNPTTKITTCSSSVDLLLPQGWIFPSITTDKETANEIVPITNLNQLEELSIGRPPSIIVVCSNKIEISDLPYSLKNSNTGGIILDLAHSSHPVGKGCGFGSADGWIQLSKRDVDLDLVRLQFWSLTRKVLPREICR